MGCRKAWWFCTSSHPWSWWLCLASWWVCRTSAWLLWLQLASCCASPGAVPCSLLYKSHITCLRPAGRAGAGTAVIGPNGPGCLEAHRQRAAKVAGGAGGAPDARSTLYHGKQHPWQVASHSVTLQRCALHIFSKLCSLPRGSGLESLTTEMHQARQHSWLVAFAVAAVCAGGCQRRLQHRAAALHRSAAQSAGRSPHQRHRHPHLCRDCTPGQAAPRHCRDPLQP